jgi:site-specific DNA recombinase
MKTIALYARVSSEQQAQEATIESQISALRERALADGHPVLPGDLYADDGYSGATLRRPALERLRDRIAEGAIDIVYVHNPDRLARRYAYQVLLLEEFAEHGASVVFLQGPSASNAEDALLVQVQGMIAEYERAKIIERCRRGKLHGARQGIVNSLSGAPYGYLYTRRSETEPARYEVLLPEAKVVRQIFDALVHEQKSIGEVVRTLNAEGTPTRRGAPRWDRATVWAILRNPAYIGQAAYGKTEAVERGQLLRPIRGRAPVPRRSKSTYRDKPPDQWIHIRVPPIVSAEVFAAARDQLERNRRLSQRNARGERYLLQGLVVCARCGYAYYGKTVSKSAAKGGRRYAYYRCVGTDAYRFAGGRVCTNKQVRSDQLDDYVWESVRKVLEDPDRVIQEWTRRSATDRGQTERRAQRDEAAAVLAGHERSLKRVLDAYEAGALDLKELTERSERIRARILRAREELQKADEKLTETVTLQAVTGRLQDFADRVRHGLDRLTWCERRQLIRTLVARVEIDDEGAMVVYRLPPAAPSSGPDGERPGSPEEEPPASIHLRERRDHPALRRAREHRALAPVLHHPCLEPLPQQLEHLPVRDASLHEKHQLVVVDAPEVVADIGVEDVVASASTELAEGLQRLHRTAPGSEAVRGRTEVRLEDRLQNQFRRHLRHPVPNRRDAQRPLLSIGLRDIPAQHRCRPVRACSQLGA